MFWIIAGIAVLPVGLFAFVVFKMSERNTERNIDRLTRKVVLKNKKLLKV
jgi:hypothetical protein